MGPVLGSSVANLSISNLTEHVRFTIRNVHPAQVSCFCPASRARAFSLTRRLALPPLQAASCAFWDVSLNGELPTGSNPEPRWRRGFILLSLSRGGEGGWSSAGCFLVEATAEDATCSCNHLTSFAILLVGVCVAAGISVRADGALSSVCVPTPTRTCPDRDFRTAGRLKRSPSSPTSAVASRPFSWRPRC